MAFVKSAVVSGEYPVLTVLVHLTEEEYKAVKNQVVDVQVVLTWTEVDRLVPGTTNEEEEVGGRRGMKLKEFGGNFGFAIRLPDGPEHPGDYPYEGYRVHLPHQCGEWEIAGGEVDGAEINEAIDTVAKFIKEAEAAYEYLVQQKQEKEEG